MRLSLGLLALALWSCETGEKQLQKGLAGPVPVEVVQSAGWSAGPLPSYFKDCTVWVKAPSGTVEHRVACGKSVDLAEDAAGTAVGFRQGDEPWRMLRLGKTGAHFLDCKTPLLNAKTPQLEKLEPIPKVWRRILDCEQADSAYHDTFLSRIELGEMLKEVQAVAGDEAAAEQLTHPFAGTEDAARTLRRRAFEWAAILALRGHPKELAAKGCEYLSRPRPRT